MIEAMANAAFQTLPDGRETFQRKYIVNAAQKEKTLKLVTKVYRSVFVLMPITLVVARLSIVLGILLALAVITWIQCMISGVTRTLPIVPKKERPPFRRNFQMMSEMYGTSFCVAGLLTALLVLFPLAYVSFTGSSFAPPQPWIGIFLLAAGIFVLLTYGMMLVKKLQQYLQQRQR